MTWIQFIPLVPFSHINKVQHKTQEVRILLHIYSSISFYQICSSLQQLFQSWQPAIESLKKVSFMPFSHGYIYPLSFFPISSLVDNLCTQHNALIFTQNTEHVSNLLHYWWVIYNGLECIISCLAIQLSEGVFILPFLNITN